VGQRQERWEVEERYETILSRMSCSREGSYQGRHLPPCIAVEGAWEEAASPDPRRALAG